MKKMGFLCCALLLVLAIVYGVMAEEPEDCTKEQSYRLVDDKCINEIPKVSGGSSFVLKKDKTLFKLTSEHDGNGFGLLFGRMLRNNVNFYSYHNDIKKITIKVNKPFKLNAFHQKQLKRPLRLGIDGFDELSSFEFLSTFDSKEVEYYELLIQVKFKESKKEKLMAVLQTEDDEEYLKPILVKKNGHSSLYKIKTDKVGVLTLGKISDD